MKFPPNSQQRPFPRLCERVFRTEQQQQQLHQLLSSPTAAQQLLPLQYCSTATTTTPLPLNSNFSFVCNQFEAECSMGIGASEEKHFAESTTNSSPRSTNTEESSNTTHSVSIPRKRRGTADDGPFRLLVSPKPTSQFSTPVSHGPSSKTARSEPQPSSSPMVVSNTPSFSPMASVASMPPPFSDVLHSSTVSSQQQQQQQHQQHHQQHISHHQQTLVFTWKHGGKNVLLAGTFNNWCEKIPMQQSHGDFTCIQSLGPGVHYYRYIVDGTWQTDPSVPVVADGFGELCNVIEISESAQEDSLFNSANVLSTSPGVYEQFANADSVLTTHSPPALPPHLKHALLNTSVPTPDPTVLPLPHHVMLNHIYTLPRKDDKVLILGVTQRYTKANSTIQKFVTTVYYKPLES